MSWKQTPNLGERRTAGGEVAFLAMSSISLHMETGTA